MIVQFNGRLGGVFAFTPKGYANRERRYCESRIGGVPYVRSLGHIFWLE